MSAMPTTNLVVETRLGNLCGYVIHARRARLLYTSYEICLLHSVFGTICLGVGVVGSFILLGSVRSGCWYVSVMM